LAANPQRSKPNTKKKTTKNALTIIKQEKYSNAFLGYGPEDKNFALELTYNYGVDSYDLGTGFGHFALASRDVAGVVTKVKAAGRKVSRDAGPVKGGKTVIAFVDDPTGYKGSSSRGPPSTPKRGRKRKKSPSRSRR
jgi:lactoylglutathione lyase